MSVSKQETQGDALKTRRSAKLHNRKGMKLLKIWVPDTSRPEFAIEAQRQALLLRDKAEERDALDFIEAAFAWPEK